MEKRQQESRQKAKAEQDRTAERPMSLEDVATALGMSKTTVSRAISGKGRIGADTVARVKAFTAAHEYRPNMIARSLAQSKTFNIGVLIPKDSYSSEMPFFQNCLTGICGYASEKDYDVIVTTASEQDTTPVRRSVVNRKVDGFILTRTLVEDAYVSYLKSAGVPFVVIGTSEDASVLQVDTDHIGACCEMTSKLIRKGYQRLALFIGNEQHIVNRQRIKGYRKAVQSPESHLKSAEVIRHLDNRETIAAALHEALQKRTDCIVCGDDYICSRVIDCLTKQGIRVPEDIMVASFYNSVLLEAHNPPIAALHIDAKVLGAEAAKMLFDCITEEGQPKNRTFLGAYSVKGIE